MQHSLKENVEKLRNVLLSLSPSGHDGFEGLISIALSKLLNMPFRLARSGSQFGLDGQSSFQSDGVSFECKRYDKEPDKKEILSKFTEFRVNQNCPDLWILACTSAISTQTTEMVRDAADHDGIFTFILDWSEESLPILACAIASADHEVSEFIVENSASEEVDAGVLDWIFTQIRQHESFNSLIDKMEHDLDVPLLSYSNTLTKNKKWWQETFSNERKCRNELGQLICLQSSDIEVQTRTDISSQIENTYLDLNSPNLLFLLGPEGGGKSWIAVQAWQKIKNPPLLLFFTPRDFDHSLPDAKEKLIEKIVKQSSSEHGAGNFERRWGALLDKWSVNENRNSNRIVVVFDGINEKPQFNWAKLIDIFLEEFKHLKITLLVTSRKPYFDNFVRRRIHSNSVIISIPEWQESERDSILNARGINPSILTPAVGKSLCNPRLLGIALRLLSNDEIQQIEELNVSRLLFEHIKTKERDYDDSESLPLFFKRLRNDANEIKQRVKREFDEDLMVFDGELQHVAEGRFYEVLDDDPNSYRICDDGLTLALALSVIYQLKKSLRNDNSVSEKLDQIIEPISSLDDTARVVVAAITVESLEQNPNQKILNVLFECFVYLQNTDENDFPVFVSAAKKCPLALALAARNICLKGGHQANYNWISGALQNIALEAELWEIVKEEVLSWLSLVSLSPQLLSPSREDLDLDKQKRRISNKLNSFSDYEEKLFSTLTETQSVHLDQLSSTAFMLLVGKPIADYASSFISWLFIQAINTSYHTPFNDFFNLIRFNSEDWKHTKLQLSRCAVPLEGKEISNVGKWALKNIYSAIGDPKFGDKEEKLYNELTKDEEKLGGRIWNETFCPVDPCDPGSIKPADMTKAIKKYDALAADRLYDSFMVTQDDRMLKAVGTCLARFEPAVTLSKHRKIIDSVLSRDGVEFRQGLFGSRDCAALMTTQQVSKAKSRWKSIELNEDLFSNAWFLRTTLLELALPYLTSSEQLHVLVSHHMEKHISLELLGILKPASENELAKFIDNEFGEYDDHLAYLFSIFVRFSKSPLNNDVRKFALWAWEQGSPGTKGELCALAAKQTDKELLSKIVKDEMTLSFDNFDGVLQGRYYSRALCAAARLGLLDAASLLERVCKSELGVAIKSVQKNDLTIFIEAVNQSLEAAVKFQNFIEDLEITLKFRTLPGIEPNTFSVTGAEAKTQDVFKFESPKESAERQKKAHRSFLAYRSDIYSKGAFILLEDLTESELAYLIEGNQEQIDKWLGFINALEQRQVAAIYNFILKFSFVIHKQYPEKAIELFEQTNLVKPWITQTVGEMEIPLRSSILWHCSGDKFKALQYRCLNEKLNDNDLSLEVLAALANDRKDVLQEYITEKVDSIQPTEVARGLMVAGFSDESEFNSLILRRFENTKGFIGRALKAAMYAYERNVWARHWYTLMDRAENPDDYWCYSRILLKIVDRRFDVWKDSFRSEKSLCCQFDYSLRDRVTSRYEKWDSKRKEKLFGSKVPRSIFVEGNITPRKSTSNES